MRTTAVVVLGGSLVLSAACGTGVKAPTSRALAEGWLLRAAATCNCRGDAVSRAGFEAAGWLPARVPTTVMAAEAGQGRFPDLYVGTNLDKVPTEPYAGPWWYRTEFELDARGGRSRRFASSSRVSTTAPSVWLNGVRLAAAGTRSSAPSGCIELDLTGRCVAGRNALAVEVHPPQPGDFTIGFVDWNPRPPDRNMGIWRPVAPPPHRRRRARRRLRPTDVDPETLASAERRRSSTARPTASDRPAVRRRSPERSSDVRFSSRRSRSTPREARGRALHRRERPGCCGSTSPRLWWPHTLGTPDLYSAAARRRASADRESDALRDHLRRPRGGDLPQRAGPPRLHGQRRAGADPRRRLGRRPPAVRHPATPSRPRSRTSSTWASTPSGSRASGDRATRSTTSPTAKGSC